MKRKNHDDYDYPRQQQGEKGEKAEKVAKAGKKVVRPFIVLPNYSRSSEPPIHPVLQRFVWPEALHMDFISAVFEIGLKQASPSMILDVLASRV